ncbi:MAG: glycosyltransferase family 39 protein [Deltaproteobacteria bacterium]|nr:glycosyltransferase family 39 protein [Deltaproteobacteria bacterium]
MTRFPTAPQPGRIAARPRTTPTRTVHVPIETRPRWVVIALVAWWVTVAALVPVILDEAYYVAWSTRLARGYLDHPPMVAYLVAAARWVPSSPFAVRIGTLAAAVVSVAAMLSLARASGLTLARDRAVALVLRFGGLIGLGLGFLATPDAPLFAAWSVALAEAAWALRGDRRRWLSAGLAVGVGLWSKYTIVLIGPVFLWGMWRGDRRALATPWPYLGGLLALAVWSPQLHWNATHDWQTIQFQLGHGFRGGHRVESQQTDLLPHAEPPLAEGPEAQLTSSLVPADTGYHKKPWHKRSWRKPVGRIRDYVLGELALWGALLVPLATLAWRAARRTRRGHGAPNEPPPGARLDPRVTPMLAAGTVLPLAFFGVASFFARAELHWPGPYLVSFAVLVAPLAASRARGFVVAALVNFAATSLVGIHALHPYLPIPRGQDRVLRETRGFDRLARHLAQLDQPIFGSTYQLVSMVRFHGPGIRIGQWPDTARPSELTLRDVQAPYTWAEVTRAGGFWLLSSHPRIAHVPGALADQLIELQDCREDGADDPLVIRRAGAPEPDRRSACTPIHAWYLAHYGVLPPPPP